MLIVFLSNYFNHHQKPFSDAIYDKIEGKYFFVETTNIPEERKKIGYKEFDAPYVMKYSTNKQYVDSLIMNADIVIIGEAPVRMVRNRLKRGLITFHDSERRYKSIIKYLKWPIYTMKSIILNKGYLLCASAFASKDFCLSGVTLSKCYKWGYFTKVEEYDIMESLEVRRKGDFKLMWCARFLKWKHPELPVKLAAVLKARGYDFTLDMYGSGTKLEETKALAEKLGVADLVKFCGNLPNEQILSHMRNHDIFLFTSDRNEGWGAVANEAMSNGCVLVASDAIGSVPYLVKDGENGCVFKSADLESLTAKVEYLLNHPEEMRRMAINGYYTMRNVWSPQNAARNLLQLIDDLQNGRDTSVVEGPCSKALPL